MKAKVINQAIILNKVTIHRLRYKVWGMSMVEQDIIRSKV